VTIVLLLAVFAEEPVFRALLVGVGAYASPEIPDLAAPANDVAAVRRALQARGFLPSNIETLVDGQATLPNFRREIEALTRVTTDRDVVVIFFSGHGSQVADGNGDEADEIDETLLFHRARVEDDVLVDDEMNLLLRGIDAAHLVLIQDSCFSGGGFRTEGIKAVPIDTAAPPLDRDLEPEGEPDKKRFVFLSATTDEGKPAREEGRLSVFTEALTRVLAENGMQPIDYRQLTDRIRAKTHAMDQKANAQGAVTRLFLDPHGEQRPDFWTVTDTTDEIVAEGALHPGWSVGAVVRVYPAAATPAQMRDPSKAEGRLRMIVKRALQGTFEPDGTSVDIEEGDLLVLASPGRETKRITASFKGFTPERREALQQWIREDTGINTWFEIVDADADFIVVPKDNRQIRVQSSDGKRTSEPADDDQVAWWLYLYALQQDFLAMKGKGHGLTDNQSLIIEILPKAPDCSEFSIRINYKEGPEDLRIGGLLLSSDGYILGVPDQGDAPILSPGEQFQLNDTYAYDGEAEDTVMVVGTTGDLSFDWGAIQLGERASFRVLDGGLRNLLDAMNPETRGSFLKGETKAWTLSQKKLSEGCD